MPKYDIKPKIVYELSYNELDRIANEFFGTPKPCAENKYADGFSIVASEELNNDTDKAFDRITKEAALEEGDNLYKSYEYSDRGDVNIGDYIRQGKCPSYCGRKILLILVLNDIIPEGDYVINVSW